MEIEDKVQPPPVRVTEAAEKVSLLEENIKSRTDLPHLLLHLRERRPEKLHYLGVSFGLTLDLFRFWRKHKFAPFYIGKIPNTVTSEHTCMVLKPLQNDEIEVGGSNEWGFFGPFYQDFRQRFTRLMASTLSIIDPKLNFSEQEPVTTTSDKSLGTVREHLSPHDMKRLDAYVHNLADFHLIVMEPHNVSVDEDLNNAAKQVEDEMKSKTEALLNPELSQQYAFEDGETGFENELENNGGKIATGGLISVKSNRDVGKSEKEKKGHKSDKRRGIDSHNYKSSKKKKI